MRRPLARAMHIITVPLFQDNYGYFLVDDATKAAFAIDPAEPAKMISAAKAAGVSCQAVLTTHHHADHSGGNASFLQSVATVTKVYGGDDRVQAVTHIMKDNDVLQVDNLLGSITCRVIHTPGHTTSHMSIYAEDKETNAKAVFTGDCLFVGGCGRFFEGTGKDMYSALIERLAALPEDTKVYCGHEYTKANLAFAKTVEPQNKVLQAWWEKAQTAKITIPSTIKDEKMMNPFMRVHEDVVQAFCGTSGDVIKTMDVLRERKNNFKG